MRRDEIRMSRRSIWVTDWPLWLAAGAWMLVLATWYWLRNIAVPTLPSVYHVKFNEVVDYPSLLAAHEAGVEPNFPILVFIPLLVAGGMILVGVVFRRFDWGPAVALSLWVLAILFNGFLCFGFSFLPFDGTTLRTEQTAEFGERVYHLTYASTSAGGSGWVEHKYLIYECDTVGKVCSAIRDLAEYGYHIGGRPQKVSLEACDDVLYLQIGQEVTRVAP